jgi:hypothetical protein
MMHGAGIGLRWQRLEREMLRLGLENMRVVMKKKKKRESRP